MHSAETLAADRLYNLEFKRFIRGKMVRQIQSTLAIILADAAQTEQCNTRLELFPSQHDRGDLGEVFCRSSQLQIAQ